MRTSTLRHALTGLLACLVFAVLGVSSALAEGPNAIRTNAAFSANTLAANDDGSTAQVPIGFTADFFGTSYSQVYVNNNGNITFDDALFTYTPFALTPNGEKIIAPFFADVDTRGIGSGLTRYGYGTGEVDGHLAFGVNWINVGYYLAHTDKLNSFQLVLIQREDTGSPNNFDIEFNYDKVQWETGDASSGSGGLGGDSVRIGYSSGSGEAYEFPTSGVDGSFLDNNLATGLISHSLNSTQLGRYVLQVRNGVVLPPAGNNAPVADAGGDTSGDEGSPISLDGSNSSDADSGDTLTYAWTYTGDAGNDAGSSCTFGDASSAQTTFTCNDDGTYTATLTVSDGTDSDTDSTTVTVNNVNPDVGTLGLTGQGGTACIGGNAVGLSFSVTDAGSNDAGDLGGSINWGDGSSNTSYTGSSYSGSHTYAPGTYTIQAGASDGDGGTGNASATNGVSHKYHANGFLAPMNMDGSSVFKLGSTVPLKIVITDCNNAYVTTLSPDIDMVRTDTAPDGPVNEVISSSAADTADLMRWSSDKYIYNLSTKRSQFCLTGTPFCTNGDLQQGTYEVKAQDPASNDSFDPIIGHFSLRK